MTKLDLKAIGFGFAAFMACTLVMTVAGTAVGGARAPSVGESQWKLINIIGYLAPVVAGYVAARQASTKRILHGTIGGSVGVLLLLAPALFVPNYPFWSIPIILTWYTALASLGAIFGNHRANRVGP